MVTASTLPHALTLTQAQVFNAILAAHFSRSQEDPFVALEPLRRLTQPTPIGLLSRAFVSEAEAEAHGYAAVLEFPFGIEDVLRVLATRLTSRLSPEHERQAYLIARLVDALVLGAWDQVRQLCLPTVRYSLLTPSLFTTATAFVGVEAVVAHVGAVNRHLPGAGLDHCVVSEQQGLLVARAGWSWDGSAGQRRSVAGSVVCQFVGERISRISVSCNQLP